MARRDVLTKIQAFAGTALVWFPILAPVLISLALLPQERTFRIDYLMPAELFPLVLVGGGLLGWAALRARSRRGIIGWGLVIAVISLVGAQAFAVVTGLASGETEPVGWPWVLILALTLIYILAVILVGVGGVLLLRDLFRSPQSHAGKTGG